MPAQGTIFLLNRIEEIIDTRVYANSWKRKQIIDNWKKIYAAKFDSCFIQINPECNFRMVNKDGTNKKKISKMVYSKEKSYLSTLPTKVKYVRKGRHISSDTSSMYDFQH